MTLFASVENTIHEMRIVYVLRYEKWDFLRKYRIPKTKDALCIQVAIKISIKKCFVFFSIKKWYAYNKMLMAKSCLTGKKFVENKMVVNVIIGYLLYLKENE